MSSQDAAKTLSEALKAEGNAFYLARKYREAYAKYTQAIEADGQNAILYANRAACSLELGECLDAKSDARKAIDLDPKYVKAWGRLGKATMLTNDWETSIWAWEQAIALYGPADEAKLTHLQVQQKRDCQDGLRAAKTAIKEQGKKSKEALRVHKNGERIWPWQRAEKMAAGVQKLAPSSAWVIMLANREFKKGCDTMKITTVKDNMVSGLTGAVADICNGILRDRRVFHLDCSNWFELYNRQANMEAEQYGAFENVGPTAVQERAFKLQKEKGWGAARPAVGITIRGWAMRGFLEDTVRRDSRGAMRFYSSAIAVLEWGTEAWKGASDSDRGSVFTSTFVRGVRRLYLSSCLSAWKEHGDEAGITLEGLDELSQAIIEDVEANKPKGNEDFMRDAGFFSSFFLYPSAEANAYRAGFRLHEKAQILQEVDPDLAKDYFVESAEMYIRATKLLHSDEELRLHYFKVACEAYWYSSSPLRQILTICEIVRSDLPKVRKIWDEGYCVNNLLGDLEVLLEYQRRVAKGVASGQFTLDSPATVIDLIALHH